MIISRVNVNNKTETKYNPENVGYTCHFPEKGTLNNPVALSQHYCFPQLLEDLILKSFQVYIHSSAP